MTGFGNMDHWQIGSKYNQLVRQLSELEEELHRRRAQNRHHIRPQDWAWLRPQQTMGMQSKSKQHRSNRLVAAELGFNVHNFHAFIVDLPPGETEGAYHIHGEAMKFYLSGRGQEIVGDRTYEVGEGDVLLVPAYTWHGTQNPFAETLRFLAIAHTNAGAPIVHQPIFRIREDLQPKGFEQSELGQALAAKVHASKEGWELGRLRHHLLQELGFLEDEMEQRRGQSRHVMTKDQLEWADLSTELGEAAEGSRVRVAKAICPELGFPAHNFIASFVEIPARGEGIRHMHGEELKYYLQGRGREVIGEAEYEVEAGDVIYVPANTWHATYNTSDQPLRFYSATQARGMPVTVSPIVKVDLPLKAELPLAAAAH